MRFGKTARIVKLVLVAVLVLLSRRPPVEHPTHSGPLALRGPVHPGWPAAR